MTDRQAMFSLLLADGAAEQRLQDPVHQHIFRSGVLVRLMLLLEHHNANCGNAEVDALREIRNAVVHNKGDLALNRNQNSLQIVQAYLANLQAGGVPSKNKEPLRPFFTLRGSVVFFDVGGVSEHCRQVFMKNVPP